MYYVGQKTLSIYLTKAIRCDIINVLFKMQVNFMSSNDTVLKRDEEYVLGLRSLYESYGYKKFKMRKFEKYDLYLENKSFLRNGGIITVTDPKGRLLALKPDITLSIVKNIKASDLPEKLYYNENVYIADSNAGEIKETTQVGLEYVGEIDIRAMAEILLLAAESLAHTNEQYRIALSHMGFVSEILEKYFENEIDRARASKLISEKNSHGLKELCKELKLSEEAIERLSGLVNVCGELKSVINEAKTLACGEGSNAGCEELFVLSQIIDLFGLSNKFILDFSVMNDMSYYNGLVFQGFINGVPKSVLSGGRYDNLVKRFGLDTSAAGFAVSTDLLNDFNHKADEYDYDVLLLYSKDCDPFIVISAEKSIIASGESCIALSDEPYGISYKRKVIINSDGSLKNE